ncbi:hypothetical protein HELRODRAFT_78741, partial [Helobdella robusta]|uniref:protein-tyrosine-phosphatase n=1 Tax=Helobdella robusta TaxID=6412 RepID=T1G3F2_HELRO
GSKEAAESHSTLKSFNITHVLNVTEEIDIRYDKKLRIKSLKIPIKDSNFYDIASQFEGAFSFIDNALLGDSKNAVLVHCYYGVSRSSTIVIAYLMYREGLSLDDAYRYLRHVRPKIRPNDGFMKQLQSYDKQLFEAVQLLTQSQ